jgi:hypothetical protein
MIFHSGSLRYLGGIITPRERSANVTPLPDAYPADGQLADSLSMGGRPFALDVTRGEFVMGTRHGRVARLKVVEPAISADVNLFPVAAYVNDAMVELSGQSEVPQPLTTNKSWFEITDPHDKDQTGFAGVQPVGEHVLIAGQTYYDANNTQRVTAAISDWPPSAVAAEYQPNRTPFSAIGAGYEQGLVSGYFAPIPPEWQEALNGDTLIGQSSLPIISRGSAGPCATSFYWTDLAATRDLPGTLLVGYPQGHWMPGHPWDNPAADDVYNFATQIMGMAILGDTIVFVGSHGYGQPCYGNGTGDPELAGTPSPDGSHWCYDPTSGAKANHAYPYRLQLWHYPLADLALAAEGEIDPWEAVPECFEIEVPFRQENAQCNGCAYDPTTKRLYISMYAADGYGLEPGPVIYCYEFVEDAEPVDPDADYVAELEAKVAALENKLEQVKQLAMEIILVVDEEEPQ